MRMCRSVCHGLHVVDSSVAKCCTSSPPGLQACGTGTIAPTVLFWFRSTLAYEATYGQVSNVFDNGHWPGTRLSWQQDARSGATRNGQFRSANPDAIHRTAIAIQYVTAARTNLG